MKVEWKCPKCGAVPDKCGKGPCQRTHVASRCEGFLCNCDDFDTGKDTDEHGESFDNVCHNAMCYHCDWSGKFPQKPKGILLWEKKALDAGWVPPTKRAEELGLAKKSV